MAVKAKTTKKPKTTDAAPAPAIVNVVLPKGCKKGALSIDALDAYTRELALKTNIDIDGRPLFCRAIKLVDQGNEPCLQITLRPGSFKIENSK